MNELVLADRAADWRRLKALVLDSVSSPITKRVYNLGLDEFIEWFGREPRPGTAKVWIYPGARDGRVIADVVRLDKGHTEGLEPKVTRRLLELVVSAPGGKLIQAG